jgi:hypothetical protein
MAESVKDVSDQLDRLQQQLEQVGVFSQNTTKNMGLFERQQLKISTALKKSPIYGMAKTLQGYAQSVSKVTAITGKNSTMTKEQKEDLRKNMTVMEKLTAATIGYGVAQKMSNKLLKISNNGFTRLLVSAFSLVSIFLIVGFALAALSIAFDGANSPVLKMTEDLGPLHDAMQGLVLVISGEGDEGGLSSALDVLAISLLAAGVASLVLGGTVGIIVGALTLAVGAARIFYNEFDNVYAAIGVGIGVFMTLIGTLMMVKKVFVLMKAGSIIAIKGTAGAVVAGIGLVIGGVAGLVAFAMGAGEGIKGVLLGIISALAVFVGLWIAGLAAAIAFPIAIGLFLIATIIRYWDEIKAFLGSALDWLIGAGAFIINGVVDGAIWLVTFIVDVIVGAVGLIVGAISFVISGIIKVVMGFVKFIVNGIVAGIKWIIGLPVTIAKGIVAGIKAVINGIIGIYNGFANMMSFKIPKWVPVIGGQRFKLPSIPRLAKGGVVDSPTLAMIGEDGPEAVVPLNRKNNPRGIGLGGGGEMTVNINVGGVTDRTDKRALAKEIGDLIRAEMTRGGRSHGNRRSSV